MICSDSGRPPASKPWHMASAGPVVRLKGRVRSGLKDRLPENSNPLSRAGVFIVGRTSTSTSRIVSARRPEILPPLAQGVRVLGGRIGTAVRQARAGHLGQPSGMGLQLGPMVGPLLGPGNRLGHRRHRVEVADPHVGAPGAEIAQRADGAARGAQHRGVHVRDRPRTTRVPRPRADPSDILRQLERPAPVHPGQQQRAIHPPSRPAGRRNRRFPTAASTPPVATRPSVGFNPATPHQAAGARIDPAVSVPTDPAQSPVATATAGPLDDESASRVGSQGLKGGGQA